MSLDLKFLEKELQGKTVPKPLSGTLSGHSAGEPFDKAVEELLKSKVTKEIKVFRQYEYLNNLYTNNPTKTSVEERHSLIPEKTLQYLLNRGNQTTKDWSQSTPFQEKQNDTADILLIDNNHIKILDVKTKNLSKKAQAPNIISALKLAEMCKLAIENNEFDKFDIKYIGIDWQLEGNELVCKKAYVKDLFKTTPNKKNLYINWAAALQIQFHVEELAQDYNKDFKNWCFDYLKHFNAGVEERAKYMIKEYKVELDK